VRAFMSEPWTDGAGLAMNIHRAEPRTGAQPLYAMGAVDEAQRPMKETEPENRPPLPDADYCLCGAIPDDGSRPHTAYQGPYTMFVRLFTLDERERAALAEALQTSVEDRETCHVCGEHVDRERNKVSKCGTNCCVCHRLMPTPKEVS
jgi:hypothetical protein